MKTSTLLSTLLILLSLSAAAAEPLRVTDLNGTTYTPLQSPDKKAAVQNNGGGHHNHTLFWSIMGPNGGGEPTGVLADAINHKFGSFAALKETVNKKWEAFKLSL